MRSVNASCISDSAFTQPMALGSPATYLRKTLTFSTNGRQTPPRLTLKLTEFLPIFSAHICVRIDHHASASSMMTQTNCVWRHLESMRQEICRRLKGMEVFSTVLQVRQITFLLYTNVWKEMKWTFMCHLISTRSRMGEGFNTMVTAGVLNLPDKRVNPDCWLRSGFESPRRQLGLKPLSGSYQLRTLHCRATLICASFGGANNILPFFIFHL